jgi:CYTH domain-containing protein
VTSRRPGEGRYARLEREQRWLLAGLPPGLSNEREIVDHYWIGTTLRLRMVQSRDEVIYKLGQKIRLNDEDPELVKITNIYLSESEFCTLSVTPAFIVSKSRWDATSNGLRFAVDEFKGRHSGLVLAEIELREDEARVSGPEYAVAEVTSANEYSGGWLAAATDAEMRRILDRG